MKDFLTLDEKFIINIFEKYKKAKLILNQENNFNFQEKEAFYGENRSNDLSNYYRHIKIVDTILSLLPQEEYTCIIRDFLNNKDNNKPTFNPNKVWWKEYYTEENYQKMRTKSISRFLYLFLI